MKKAIIYMALGACAYGLANKMMCSDSSFEKEMKKMKKTGMEALNKVKAIF